MIARHESYMDRTDIWTRLSAPLPEGVVSWRQDGGIVARDGRHFARFVAYVDANTVRERLDGVVPGEWDLTLELLPTLGGSDDGDGNGCTFKARLQILGVIREDVGTGRDYKSAATDAFKRAAVRFGVAHELYALEQNWVEMDGDGRGARPLEDPAVAYSRRHPGPAALSTPARRRGRAATGVTRTAPADDGDASAQDARSAGGEVERALRHADAEVPACPSCGGRMWDNRLSKRNPKAPDFKCRDRSCDGVVWPARNGREAQPADGASGADTSEMKRSRIAAGPLVELDEEPVAEPAATETTGDDLPF